MPNFALEGYGAAIPGIQNMQNNNLVMALKRLQLAQYQRQAQQQAQAQQGTPGAMERFAATQGQGVGGTITPQQIAGISTNPDIQNQIMSLMKGYTAPTVGYARAELQGQNALDRTQLTGENALERAQLTGENAATREQAKEQSAMERLKSREAAQKAREDEDIASGKYAKGAGAAGKNLDYDTAKAQYLEAEKDLRNLQGAYRDNPDPTAYFNSPQWGEIAKRRNDSLAAMKAAASSGKQSSAAGAAAIPPATGAKQAPDGNWYVETSPGQFSRVDTGP